MTDESLIRVPDPSQAYEKARARYLRLLMLQAQGRGIAQAAVDASPCDAGEAQVVAARYSDYVLDTCAR